MIIEGLKQQVWGRESRLEKLRLIALSTMILQLNLKIIQVGSVYLYLAMKL